MLVETEGPHVVNGECANGDVNGVISLNGDIASPRKTDAWSSTLDKVKCSVVALKVTFCTAFSGDPPQTARATGFVVGEDLILTNRHVIGAGGPISATALFDQNEEVEVFPVYRDPIHDFGFLRFNRSDVRFTKIFTIPLRPDQLKPGTDIRVVGNDSGEKLQILCGIIGRTDRNVPNYSNTFIQDENTFYVGSASNTSGGSSGSPVINVEGNAVALNAGGAMLTASSFYLPLDRVKRALEIIQGKTPREVDMKNYILTNFEERNGNKKTKKTDTTKETDTTIIPRGTVTAGFKYQYFDACRRLGLPQEVENDVIKFIEETNPETTIKTGMLTVDTVIPEGVSFKKLQPGDVLVDIAEIGAGKSTKKHFVPDFLALESILDHSCGKELLFTVYRGGEKVQEEILVKNFDLDFPMTRFVEVGGGVFHDLPYSYCKVMNRPRKGVWTTSRGYVMGNHINCFSSIHKINDGKEIDNLEDFAEALKPIKHHERFSVSWYKQMVGESRTQKSAGVLMEKAFATSGANATFWQREPKKNIRDAETWVRKEDKEKEEAKKKKKGSVDESDEEESNSDAEDAEDEAAMCEEHIDIPKNLSELKTFWTANRNLPHFAKKVLPHLVIVEFRTPLGGEILGCLNRNPNIGCGIIIDVTEDEVIIACDRETAPQHIGIVQVELAGIAKVFGTVKFIHPFHNIVLLSVERKRFGDYPIGGIRPSDVKDGNNTGDNTADAKPKLLNWCMQKQQPGDPGYFLGLSDKGDLVIQEVNVLSYFMPNYKLISTPVWRERNLTGYTLSDDLAGVCGGVLCTKNGDLIGLYSCFMSQDDEKYRDYEYAVMPIRDYVAPLLPNRRIAEVERTASIEEKMIRRQQSGTEEDDGDIENNDDEVNEEKSSDAEEDQGPPTKKHKTSDENAIHVSSNVGSDSATSSNPTSEQDAKLGRQQDTFAGQQKSEAEMNLPNMINYIPSLSCEMRSIQLSNASNHGVSDGWIQELMKAADTNMQCLFLERITKDGCSDKGDLQEGDILLKVNGKTIVTHLDVEDALMSWWINTGFDTSMNSKFNAVETFATGTSSGSKTASTKDSSKTKTTVAKDAEVKKNSGSTDSTIEITLIRDRKEINTKVRPDLVPSDTATELMLWNGMLLIKTPKAVLERSRTRDCRGVYCARTVAGSPATAHEIQPMFNLQKIDGHSIIEDKFQLAVDPKTGKDTTVCEKTGMVNYMARLKILLQAKYSTKKKNKKEAEKKRETAVENGEEKRGTDFNDRFTRIEAIDLENRQVTKTLLRNDIFFPATHMRRIPGMTGRYKVERL